MRFFPRSFRECKVRLCLVFALQILMASVLLQLNAAGQDADSAAPGPEQPPPPPAAFQNPIPSDQLAFLNDFTGKTPKEILKDKRFRNLMKQVTPNTTYHYGSDMPLSETRDTLLNGTPMPIDIREGR